MLGNDPTTDPTGTGSNPGVGEPLHAPHNADGNACLFNWNYPVPSSQSVGTSTTKKVNEIQGLWDYNNHI